MWSTAGPLFEFTWFRENCGIIRGTMATRKTTKKAAGKKAATKKTPAKKAAGKKSAAKKSPAKKAAGKKSAAKKSRILLPSG